MKFKSLFVGAAILASAVLGDYYNVNDRFVAPVKYKDVKFSPECYQQPFKLQKKYLINEKGNLEIYIGNKDTWHKISKDLRVNERKFGYLLKEESREIESYIKKKISDITELYEKIKNGSHN